MNYALLILIYNKVFWRKENA